MAAAVIPQTQPGAPSFLNGWKWFAACFAIVAVAAFLRIYDLDLKPMHHDEGVNGYFLLRLHKNNSYHYDPSNYHGPTIYYLALLSTYIFGITTTAVRLVPALFGAGTVLLTFLLRSRLGTLGTLAAALLIAISPGAVYISRYFIHESLLVFSGLAVIVAALRYYDSGAPLSLMIAFVAFGFMCATKETFIIWAVVVALAAGLTPVYLRIRSKATKSGNLPDDRQKKTVEMLGGRSRVALSVIGGVGLFVIVIALLFSGIFSNPNWSVDIFRAFKIWGSTARTKHTHEYYTYVWWLMQEEMPILVFGLIGAGLALWRVAGRFPIFAAFWTVGLLAAYSLIPYKTPWLTLNFIIPLALMSGYAITVLHTLAPKVVVRLLLATLVIIGFATTAYQMTVLNYISYDDPKHPYVYAQTHRDFYRLMDDLSRITGPADSEFEGAIAVMAPQYWPLPWYLRDYKRVSYHSKITKTGDEIIICSESQEPELQELDGGAYHRMGSYMLWPGVNLALYAKRSTLESINPLLEE